MTAAQIILGSLVWLAGVNGLFLLFSPLFAPALFLRYSDFTFGPRGSRDMPWWGMPIGFFGLLSLGRVIYCALYSVTFVIPADLGGLNGDGDWESTRYLVTMMATVVITLALFGVLPSTAKRNLAHRAG